ncbi:MAG: hypothetical protein ACOCWM_06260 [Cyclobacteriaceae bacterium]
MLDLEKLDKEIDELLENETSSSLTEWLVNKRYSNFNNLIGKGTFVGMKRQSFTVLVCSQKAKFKQDNDDIPPTPINRQAA